MTHVRTIGKIVRPELADKELEKKRRFIRRAAGCVEDSFVRRSKRIELAGDQPKRVIPGDRLIVVGAYAPHYRLGQAALRVQPELLPIREIRDRVPRKKLGGDPLLRSFIRQRLCTAFAELGDSSL